MTPGKSTKSKIPTVYRRSRRALVDALAVMPTVKFVMERKFSLRTTYECGFCTGTASREIHGGWSIEHLPNCPLLRGVPDCESYQP